MGDFKGVGRLYQQTFIGTYSKIAFCKLNISKTLIAAANAINEKVFPFFKEHVLSLLRILTDRGTEYVCRLDHHDCQRSLAINDIDLTKTKAMSPKKNGICVRSHKTILNECYQTISLKNLYLIIDELQKYLNDWMEYYNDEGNHQGKMYCE